MINDTDSKFDRFIEHVPLHKRGPMVDVVDTAHYIRYALEDWGIPKAAQGELLVGLTRLVLELHAKEQGR